MPEPVEWKSEFARVISCTLCTQEKCREFLPHSEENLPQPGYIGPRYHTSRVLFVGQNPGIAKRLLVLNDKNTAAIRALRNEPTESRYRELNKVLEDFIPQWKVFTNYVPLVRCGLSLKDIAYCNIVRCRTIEDKKPGTVLTRQCLDEHFVRWLDLLTPRVVVFIGKWASDQGGDAVSAKGIPCTFVNRRRSHSQAERDTNRAEVIALVKQHRG